MEIEDRHVMDGMSCMLHDLSYHNRNRFSVNATVQASMNI